MEEELEEALKDLNEVRTHLLDALAKLRAQLKARTAHMIKPSARSYDAVMPYSSDGEVFLHYWYNHKWAHKMIAFDPTNGQSRTIELADFSM